MTRFLKLIITIVLFGVAVYAGIAFGWQNSQYVNVKFMNNEYSLPLFALCYVFLGAGGLIVSIIISYDYIKMYAQNRSLKRELRYYIRMTQEKQFQDDSTGSFQSQPPGSSGP